MKNKLDKSQMVNGHATGMPIGRRRWGMKTQSVGLKWVLKNKLFKKWDGLTIHVTIIRAENCIPLNINYNFCFKQ